jgi:hypothetical protein
MKLQLSRPDSPYKTVIDVEHDVTITDPRSAWPTSSTSFARSGRGSTIT